MPMTTSKLTRRKLEHTSYLESDPRGKPILFLHGFPGSAYSWEHAANLLLEKHPGQYRIIIPDLLGFGESDTGGNDWSMEGQAHAIAALLKRLNLHDLFLATHDFGGPVALTLLRVHPEIKIRKLMISATNLFTDTPIPLPLRSAGIPLLGDLIYGTMAGSIFGFRMMYQFAAQNKNAVTWQKFRQHATPHGMASTARIFQHNLADLPGNYRLIQEFASQLQLPTLILWGDCDPFFPVSVAKRSEATIQNSILKIYSHTGHFIPEERAVEVADDLASFFNTQ
jgi:pimeloyl-ACP methyl ester carboxylesterase